MEDLPDGRGLASIPPEERYQLLRRVLDTPDLQAEVQRAHAQLDSVLVQLGQGQSSSTATSSSAAAAAAFPGASRRWRLPSKLADESQLQALLTGVFLRHFLPHFLPFLKRAASEMDDPDAASSIVQRVNQVVLKFVKLAAVTLPWCHMGILEAFCALFAEAYSAPDLGDHGVSAGTRATGFGIGVGRAATATSGGLTSLHVLATRLPGAMFADARSDFMECLRVRRLLRRQKTSLKAFTKRSIDLVGRCIQHLWERTNLRYSGMLVDYNPVTRKHLVHYVDGERQWCLLESLRGLTWLKDKYVKTKQRELDMSANDVDKVLVVMSKTLRKKKTTFDEALFDWTSENEDDIINNNVNNNSNKGGSAGGSSGDKATKYGFTEESRLTIKAYDVRTRRHLVQNEDEPGSDPHWIDVTQDMVPFAYHDKSARKVVTEGGVVKIKCYDIKRKCSALGVDVRWYTPDPARRLAFDKSDERLRLRVWWPGEKQWFKAVVRRFVPREEDEPGAEGEGGVLPSGSTGHLLKFDDGEKKWCVSRVCVWVGACGGCVCGCVCMRVRACVCS
jgi:hypothetical protein